MLPVQAAALAGVHCTQRFVARSHAPAPIAVQSLSARQQFGPRLVAQAPVAVVVLTPELAIDEPLPFVDEAPTPVVFPPVELPFDTPPLLLPPLLLAVLLLVLELLPLPPRFDESPPQAATTVMPRAAAIASPTCTERIRMIFMGTPSLKSRALPNLRIHDRERLLFRA